MTQKINTYIDRLKEFYKDDLYSLAKIDQDAKSVEYSREMAEFRKHSHSERLYKAAIERYKASSRKLLSKQDMTQEERNLTFLDMDWARWYISALGGNPEETEKTLEAELEAEMKRLNLL